MSSNRTRKMNKASLPCPQRTGELLLFLIVECAERLVRHINIKLRYLLERRGGQLRLYSTLECEEMIARMVRAELFKDDTNAND